MASTHPVALKFLIEIVCCLLGVLGQALAAFLAKATTLATGLAALLVMAFVAISLLMISAFVALL